MPVPLDAAGRTLLPDPLLAEGGVAGRGAGALDCRGALNCGCAGDGEWGVAGAAAPVEEELLAPLEADPPADETGVLALGPLACPERGEDAVRAWRRAACRACLEAAARG